MCCSSGHLSSDFSDAKDKVTADHGFLCAIRTFPYEHDEIIGLLVQDCNPLFFNVFLFLSRVFSDLFSYQIR